MIRTAFVLMLPLLTLPIPLSGQCVDQQLTLAQEVARLLTGYGQFKGFLDTRPAAVETTFAEDRKAVFHAGVRAMFVTDVLPKNGSSKKCQLIDFVDAITGVWGARPGNSNGKHQFRLSIKWRPELHRLLSSGSLNFPESAWPHVLMAVKEGGDDDPRFTKFDVRINDVLTYRQIVTEPKLQISYLKNSPTCGEIDIDFDVWRCHGRPSNSDPASVGAKGHSHPKMFKDAFSHVLPSGFLDSCNHCRRSYGDTNCKQ